MNFVEKEKAIQITTRIFIDDLEELLKERYDIEAELASDLGVYLANRYIEKYIRAKIVFELDGEAKSFVFLGKEYDDDLVICYLEIPEVNVQDFKTFSVQNEILTDLYLEQKKHCARKMARQKKSFVFVQGNDKGMLNL